jgi:raffinose/stachyose/melibiose transport system substrate-binding protein
VFVKAGEVFKQLVDLQPFQPGFLAATAPQSYGQFADGKGAMTLMGNWLYNSQRGNAADKKGLADDAMAGSRSRPSPAARATRARRWAASTAGW